MEINTKRYIENHLKIQTKSMNVAPLILNAPQRKMYETISKQYYANKPVRLIILKARQMGFSTLTEAILFKLAATQFNTNCAVVAHTDEASTNLFNMSKFYYNNLDPECLKPQLQTSNAKELVFGKLNSRIRCYTAGGDGIGRSATIHNLHISELAWWKCDKKQVLLGLLQAVPNTNDSAVIIESTANGYDYFKELWDNAVKGVNDYYPLFVGWHELEEYRLPYDGFKLTAEESGIKRKYGLSNEQLAWRRWCIANNCGGDVEKFHQEYPITPEEAFISSGNSVFNKKAVTERLAQSPRPLKRGYFDYDVHAGRITNINWVDDERGYIKIYAEPKKGYPYVIGGDTAGEGSDSFVGQVLNNISGEQAAVLTQKTDEDLYAEQMYCLGKYYNDALIGIEANFSSYPIKHLAELGYPSQYVREVEDSITKKIRHAYGFKTTSLTRPVILSELIRLMRDNLHLISDTDTLSEFLTFVRNAVGRMEAEQGAHDDHVMALAIAYYIRPQCRSYVDREKTKKKICWELDDDNEYTENSYSNYFDGGM